MSTAHTATPANAIDVTFMSKGRSGRVWSAVFDLGNAVENALAASSHAWKHHATITRAALSKATGSAA